jgi:hypothetical protein
LTWLGAQQHVLCWLWRRADCTPGWLHQLPTAAAIEDSGKKQQQHLVWYGMGHNSMRCAEQIARLAGCTSCQQQLRLKVAEAAAAALGVVWHGPNSSCCAGYGAEQITCMAGCTTC